MAEIEQARRTFEAERKAVLDGLRSIRKRELAEAKRHDQRMRALRLETHELLIRAKAGWHSGGGWGRAVYPRGVADVVELAEALGVSRQKAHRLLREAVEEQLEADRLIRPMREGHSAEEALQVLTEKFGTRGRAEAVLRRIEAGYGPLARPWRAWTEQGKEEAHKCLTERA